jgi:zinc/manganese transport system permease protein
LVSGIVGVFTVMRGQSFAGHALTDVATTGGSGAFFFNFSPLVGFLGAGVLGAGAMDLVGWNACAVEISRRESCSDSRPGLAALFLYLDATKNATTGVSQQILFGSIFTLDSSTIPLVIGYERDHARRLSSLIYRPLLLSSISPDLAAARGYTSSRRRGPLHAHARRRGGPLIHRHWVASVDGS